MPELWRVLLSFTAWPCCPGRVFSREQLYNAAWGEDYELGTNTVDNTIWRLRNKLEPDLSILPTSRPFFGWDIKLKNSIPKASDTESASVSGAIFCHYKKPKCDEKKGDFTFLDEVLMISSR
ncbi:MAG: winged helix-turn-helix domain-containing protein [Oscillospiraceae bacterium]